jgi:hypothetical protein
VAIAAVLRLRLVLSEKFDTVVRTTPEIEPYVPHDSLIWAVLRYVERAAITSVKKAWQHQLTLRLFNFIAIKQGTYVRRARI